MDRPRDHSNYLGDDAAELEKRFATTPWIRKIDGNV